MKILVIDCYDSFTYNLCQQIGKTGCNLHVFRNDADIKEVMAGEYDRIILSPGPGKPEDAGICTTILDELGQNTPTLGVCLGHQVICSFYGGDVLRTNRPVHGRTSVIEHDSKSIYSGLPSPLSATRYHSLAVDADTIPTELIITARSSDDGMIMGVRHRHYPVEGVQFHPESVLTGEGDRLMNNFIRTGVCR